MPGMRLRPGASLIYAEARVVEQELLQLKALFC